RRRADVRQVKHTQIKQASCFLINRPKQALHSVSGIASDESAGAISEASMEQTSVAGAAASADDAALRPSVVTREAVATATAPHQPRPLGRNRDFLLLWTGQAVSVFGTRVAAIAYPLLVLSPTQLARAIARNESREYSALLVGTPAGGALFAVSRSAPFLADTISYCASALGLLLIRTKFQEAPAPRRRLRHEVAEGVAHLWREPFLRTTVLLEAGANFVSNGVAIVAIVVARTSLGASATEVGLMLAIAAVGGLVGSLVAPLVQPRVHPRVVVAVGTWSWA